MYKTILLSIPLLIPSLDAALEVYYPEKDVAQRVDIEVDKTRSISWRERVIYDFIKDTSGILILEEQVLVRSKHPVKPTQILRSFHLETGSLKWTIEDIERMDIEGKKILLVIKPVSSNKSFLRMIDINTGTTYWEVNPLNL